MKKPFKFEKSNFIIPLIRDLNTTQLFRYHERFKHYSNLLNIVVHTNYYYFLIQLNYESLHVYKLNYGSQ